MKKFYLWFILLLFFDIGTKVWAESTIPYGDGIKVSDHFSFVVVHNKGIGFGLFSSHPQFVLIVQLIGVLSITLFLRTFSDKHTILESVIKILILSGGIGNLLNRLIFGYVIDFISIKPYPFVFNVADIELRIGLLLIIFLIIKNLRTVLKLGKSFRKDFL